MHDKNGTLLGAGDKVIIVGEVTGAQATPEYCNLNIQLDPMPPYKEPYNLTLNTKQVVLLEKALAQ